MRARLRVDTTRDRLRTTIRFRELQNATAFAHTYGDATSADSNSHTYAKTDGDTYADRHHRDRRSLLE